jgi:S-formylglutathione hydrolase
MLTRTASARCFGGEQLQFQHTSAICGGVTMTFSVFLPPQAAAGPVPVLWWLSGLTCTDQNFVTKAGAQRVAAELGIAIVAPDTSPRGAEVPGDPDGAWDFGLGASYYVDATEEPYRRHYQMARYLTEELPDALAALPLDLGRQSISGHSMGGHGALVLALRAPTRYRSVSALAPICALARCPWGEKALTRLLGADRAAWMRWDAAALLGDCAAPPPIRVDQGSADGFLATQLRLDLLRAAAANPRAAVEVNLREGYDHSYFFVATFLEAHLRWHAAALHG